MKNLLRKRVPAYWFVVTIVFYFIFMRLTSGESPGPEKAIRTNDTGIGALPQSGLHTIYLKDNAWIWPLLLMEDRKESVDLQQIKMLMHDYINAAITNTSVGKASVYLLSLEENSFITENADEVYNPGSLSKVVIMLAVLRYAENHPEFLDKKTLSPEKDKSLGVEENGTPSEMITGNNYSIRQLISFMIIDSDNDAMALLIKNIGIDRVNKVYSDMELDVFHNSFELFLNVRSVARLFEVLYNATYLTKENSEFALATLCKAKYSRSLTRNLPAGISVAHKYGIVGHDTTKYLSEAGIVYLDKSPYLMVVMTKGTDFNMLSDVISALSDIAFTHFAGKAPHS